MPPTAIPRVILDFEDKRTLYESRISATKSQVMAMDLNAALAKFANGGFFDTGLLPVGHQGGVLAIRGGFGHLQIVYQVEPGLYHTIWGRSERDQGAGYYDLAQPYRIWIADFYNGNISGARHFYSSVPCHGYDTKLFHVNLPNTNCKGYSGTGVGWMCLYHKDDTTKKTLPELIAYAYQRASGMEAYNDVNMSGTDGPRYYAAKGAPKHWTDAKEWQKKSLKDGFQWTLDPTLLLPVMVKSMDDQASGHDGKHHLTLGDAMNGTYNSYYQDTYPLKPIAAYQRGVLAEKYPTLASDFFLKCVQSDAQPAKNASIDGLRLGADFTALRTLPVSSVPFVPHGACDVCKKKVPNEELQLVFTDLPDTWVQYQAMIVDNKTGTDLKKVCAQCTDGVRMVKLRWMYEEASETDFVAMTPLYCSSIDENTWIYYGNDVLSSACPECGYKYPRYADLEGLDWHVWGRIDGMPTPIGCFSCQPHVACVVTTLNVRIEDTEEYTFVDYSQKPPTTYDAVVARWVIEGPNAQYKACACHMLTHNSRLSNVVYEGWPVCEGCTVKEGGDVLRYKSIFHDMEDAVQQVSVNGNINPVATTTLD